MGDHRRPDDRPVRRPDRGAGSNDRRSAPVRSRGPGRHRVLRECAGPRPRARADGSTPWGRCPGPLRVLLRRYHAAGPRSGRRSIGSGRGPGGPADEPRPRRAVDPRGVGPDRHRRPVRRPDRRGGVRPRGPQPAPRACQSRAGLSPRRRPDRARARMVAERERDARRYRCRTQRTDHRMDSRWSRPRGRLDRSNVQRDPDRRQRLVPGHDRERPPRADAAPGAPRRFAHRRLYGARGLSHRPRIDGGHVRRGPARGRCDLLGRRGGSERAGWCPGRGADPASASRAVGHDACREPHGPRRRDAAPPARWAIWPAIIRLRLSGLDGLAVMDGTDLAGLFTRASVGRALRSREGDLPARSGPPWRRR